MSTRDVPPPEPGQAKRIFGSMLVPLGAGLILETSYQWSGIGIILIAVGLVGLGWREHWQGK